MSSENKIIDYRYGYHLSPEKGWMNDPNGLCYYKGKYHVFYQTNPHENKPRNICWGHFSSSDLIHWEKEPLALVPTEDYEKDGCFSGSSIVLNNLLYLFYTGHKNLEKGYEETQCLAVSEDGIHFKKLDSNPVIVRPPEDNTQRFRDPKIWEEDSTLYAVIGGESTEGRGQVNIYQTSSIASDWSYLGKLVIAKMTDGVMWECPDYFTLNNNKFLIASPKEMKNQGVNGFSSVWLTGDLQKDKTLFDYELTRIDEGNDFYAPQTFFDPVMNRRILFAWLGMPGLQELEYQSQVGALTLPREVTFKEEKLFFYPVEEINQLREEKQEMKEKCNIKSHSEVMIHHLESSFSIQITDEKGKVNYSIDYSDKKIVIALKDNLRSVRQEKKIANIHEIRLFLDNGITELYINHGEITFTNKCDLQGELVLETSKNLKGSIYTLKEVMNEKLKN